MSAGVHRSDFGRLHGGQAVERFRLRSAGGTEACVLAYGGIIQSLVVPGMGDVVLGFDSLEHYVRDQLYFGAIIGRFANRIRGGRFTLDGREYALETNNGPNHLHGGSGGFHQALWAVEPVDGGDGAAAVRLTHTSPDGDQGYPGRLDVSVTYRLGDDELTVEYRARTDAPTLVNLTQHTYFNLSGDPSRQITDHELRLEADRYTPVDATLIPTGELAPVDGTPFDFRAPRRIGAHIDGADVQLELGRGYDHNFVLNSGGGAEPALAATVRDPATRRVLRVLTTEPGMQLYSGNYLNGAQRGKEGVAYGSRAGLCLEPQHFPDSPNQPSFPSAVLRPGREWRSTTIYRFSVE